MPKGFNATTKGQDIDVYRAAMSPAELAKLRRTLAKRANQRIVRLERASSAITGEKYSEIGALPIAREYLSKTGRKRFTEALNTKMDYEQQRREVIKLQEFLSSKTSTVSGIREIERKRISTFESGQWGSAKWTGKARKPIKFATTKEFYDFFQSGIYRELLSSGFSSEQILESYDEAVENYSGRHEEAMTALEEALQKFRDQGRMTLKDLRSAAGGQKLT